MSQSRAKGALGELVIIVLGVLIALFAESAWQDYRDRVKGREYVARLAAEARTNLDILEGDKSWARISCASANNALSLLQAPEGETDPTAFLHSVVLAVLYSNPTYQRATHDDLVGTGGLSLIDDATLRSRIVAAYTNFFESLDAWRPPKDDPLRAAVLRSLPAEFVNRVSMECIGYSDAEYPVFSFKACSTAPADVSAGALLDKLKSRPDLEGDLMERVWQTCEFEEDMSAVAERFGELVRTLDSAY